MTIVVEILYTSCCPLAPQTEESIVRVSNEKGIRITLNKILIDTHEKAIEYQFLGSPSVRVNGSDLDPRVRRAETYGVT